MDGYRYNPMRGTPPVVKNLLIINALMLLATWVLKSTYNFDLTDKLGLFYFKSEYFRPYQFVTHMFMHGGIMHLFFNMFALWMFGRVLESVWGSKRFFIYYMITGLGAAALHTFVSYLEISHIQNVATALMNTPTPDGFAEFVKKFFPEYYNQIYSKLLDAWYANPSSTALAQQAQQFTSQLIQMRMNIPTIGASGAVFGVLLAFGMLFPNTRLMLLFPPIPIKAKYFVIFYGLLELYLGISQPGSNIAHFAHIGGMLFGFIMIKLWKTDRTNFY
ncbi:MAG TPA: rhomboid family intramembrane serine protease [Bacteroidales bacterium]|nr:rhomboid family intramembrane serine protease [Bacteroidales bacterium]